MHDSQSQDHSAHGTPPDRGAQGDVSTTGHSAHDAHGAGDAHDAHGGHGHGHGDDTGADVSTLVPTTWKQLVLPALILVLVAILVSGPVFNAFATRPAAPARTEQNTGTGTTGGEEHGGEESGGGEHTTTTEGTATPSDHGGGAIEEHGTPTVAATPATAPTGVPEVTRTVEGAVPAHVAATRTSVAEESTKAEIARMPVELEFGNSTYVVKAGTNLLPDWKPSEDVGIATWIEGTYANHILYVPYNAQNEALFKAAKSGDTMKVTMNTGQVFVFSITRSERVINGPPTSDGQFTVTTAMKQDHAGVTLFLVGDPALDRAVVQADFTGTIQ